VTSGGEVQAVAASIAATSRANFDDMGNNGYPAASFDRPCGSDPCELVYIRVAYRVLLRI